MTAAYPADVDVLIVGGGVQGLWLLHDLTRRGYSALLVERRELGGEQTCHSHVYIHHGHLYQEDQGGLTDHLHDVRTIWREWLDDQAVERGFGPSCFGFQNPADAQQKTALWRLLGLPVQEMAVPPILAAGVITTTYRTDEPCLVGSSLVDALRHGRDHLIARIDEIHRIGVRGEGYREAVTEVVVRVGSSFETIRPRALVLAAGSGNHALLDLAGAGRRHAIGRTAAAQQLRLGHMLVLRGPRERLPPLTGIFPKLGGLFLVSREIAGAAPETVWLVSDNRSPPLARPDDWLRYDARGWLGSLVLALQQLAPRLFADGMDDALTWGVYAAPKAEGTAGGELPNQPCLGQFGFANLWAVWPTKLTLAPLASRTLEQQIEKWLGAPQSRDPATPTATVGCPRPSTAPERWQVTTMVPWREFAPQYGLIGGVMETGR